MEYMDLYNACDCRANKGLEELKKYVDGNKELIYTEIGDGENVHGIITIEVEYWADEEHIITEILGVWEFDSKGRCIE